MLLIGERDDFQDNIHSAVDFDYLSARIKVQQYLAFFLRVAEFQFTLELAIVFCDFDLASPDTVDMEWIRTCRYVLDLPRTPYDRVLASDHITDKAKENLKIVHKSFNPFILKRKIEKKLRVIFQYVKVTSNVRQRI